MKQRSQWTHVSHTWIEGYIDCPDLFALPIDGDPKRMKWVLSRGARYYSIGEFDGWRFIPESSRLPAPEGRVVGITWDHVDTVDAPFTQLMSFPTTLSLRTTSDSVRLCREPVDTIRSPRIRTYDIPAGPLTSSTLLTELTGAAWDIEALMRVGTANPVMLSIGGGEEYVHRPVSQMLSSPRGAPFRFRPTMGGCTGSRG